MIETIKVHNYFQNILVALAILSGVLNSFISAYIFKVNFTLLVLVLIVIDVIYNVMIRRIVVKKYYTLFLSLILLFYGIMVMSLIYSPSIYYKYIKTANFVVNCIFFSYPVFVKKINFDKIITIIKYTAVSLTVFYVYQKHAYWLPENAIHRVPGNSFLLLSGAYLGLGVLVSLVLIYESFKNKWKLVVLLLILLLASGGRGSFLFSTIVLIVFHYSKIKIKLPKKISATSFTYFFIAILGVVIVCLKYGSRIKNIFLKGFSRFEQLASFSTDKSSLGRIDHYKFALTEIFSSFQGFFIGYGVGSYGVMNGNVDKRWYPHNIILEAWFEMGVFAALLITSIVLFPLGLVKGRIEMKAIFFYLLLTAMKSSNLTDLWLLFLFMGVLLVNDKNDSIEHKSLC